MANVPRVALLAILHPSTAVAPCIPTYPLTNLLTYLPTYMYDVDAPRCPDRIDTVDRLLLLGLVWPAAVIRRLSFLLAHGMEHDMQLR
jgi:hypothetical protein